MAVTKSMSHASGYRFARKSFWGDLWRFPVRLSRVVAREYVTGEVLSWKISPRLVEMQLLLAFNARLATTTNHNGPQRAFFYFYTIVQGF